MNQYYKKITIKKSVLLLQGPVGPFFKYFAEFLMQNKTQVHKINFHVGEQFFFNTEHSELYRGCVAEWEEYFSEKILRHQVQQIFLIGAHKIYHKIAIEYCQQNNIEVYVFEEGYIRSNYITIEQNGVNGDTSLSKNPLYYLEWDNPTITEPPDSITLNAAARYYNHLRYYYRYSWGLFLSQWRLPNYQHHIQAKGLRTFFKWNKFFASLAIATIFPFKKERNSKWIYLNENKYYIVILQINTDSAIKAYSQYGDMQEFIQEVMQSFAAHAPKDCKLLIKHHPYDRGIHCYQKQIKRLTNELNLHNRVNYIIDAHLDLALEKSLGCIVVNSTSGFTALAHEVPTIALSKQALYNIPGLTNQCALNEFWHNPLPPETELFRQFKSNLIYKTQMRGCFYGGTICDFHRKFQFKH